MYRCVVQLAVAQRPRAQPIQVHSYPVQRRADSIYEGPQQCQRVGASLALSPSIKSIAVIFDSHLTFDHVAAVSKSCYFHIRALRHIRASLPNEVTKTVACSIVSFRLDYCNSLLVGMSEINFSKLQCVQNTLVPVFTGTKRDDYVNKELIHITPVLAKLHWLPVMSRVSFKLATLVYNIRQSGSSSYLASLLVDYKPVRELRSFNQICYWRLLDPGSRLHREHSVTRPSRIGTLFR